MKAASSPAKDEQDVEFANFLESHGSNKPGPLVFSNGQRYLSNYGTYVNVYEKEDREKLTEHIIKYHSIGFPLPLCENTDGGKLRLYLDLEALCNPGSEDKAFEVLTGEMLTWILRKLMQVYAPSVLAKGSEG